MFVPSGGVEYYLAVRCIDDGAAHLHLAFAGRFAFLIHLIEVVHVSLIRIRQAQVDPVQHARLLGGGGDDHGGLELVSDPGLHLPLLRCRVPTLLG